MSRTASDTPSRSIAGSTAARPRATRQRAAVAGILQRTTEFRSAQQIHAALEAEGTKVGLATVYRNLTALADSGQVDQVRSADGEILYRSCERVGHHHHIVCRGCGHAEEVAGDEARGLDREGQRGRRVHPDGARGGVLRAVPGLLGTRRGRPGLSGAAPGGAAPGP